LISIVRRIKGRYRSGKDSIGEGFFAPCLNHCCLYKRAVGYFSSAALRNWAGAFPRFVGTSDVTIKLIISPQLSNTDLETLQRATTPQSKLELLQLKSDQLLELAIELSSPNGSVRAQSELLAWLVASERLEIRFAFPVHVNDAGIFHLKTGVFVFPDGDKIAFTGSANETDGGHRRNYESLHCYRSWDERDLHRIDDCESEFDEAWNNLAEGLVVVTASKEEIDRIKQLPIARPSPAPPSNKWRHQSEAAMQFMQLERGILNMATGTGKTRTSLLILEKLLDAKTITSAIISTFGNDLLDQWFETISEWAFSNNIEFTILRQYGSYKELEKYLLEPRSRILICSRRQLVNALDGLSAEQQKDLILVHDEVHGLAEPATQKALTGRLKPVRYSLGLSATPIRDYDDAGTEFIFREVGDVIFTFSLQDAIERGILCEFDYMGLEYELTENDKKRIGKAYSIYHAKIKSGQAPSKETLWRDIARVYKTAEQKPLVFEKYVRDFPNSLLNSIIFVETKSLGDKLLPTIHDITHKFSTYYDTDGPEILQSFTSGNIDCLITCHRLSQGIDIQHLQNVFLVSSNRGHLETTQRIGRCLRSNPTNPIKRATIIDFIRAENDANNASNSDQLRSDWLTTLSEVKRNE
jgi:superfamily II DNA or RNA helicase